MNDAVRKSGGNSERKTSEIHRQRSQNKLLQKLKNSTGRSRIVVKNPAQLRQTWAQSLTGEPPSASTPPPLLTPEVLAVEEAIYRVSLQWKRLSLAMDIYRHHPGTLVSQSIQIRKLHLLLP